MYVEEGRSIHHLQYRSSDKTAGWWWDWQVIKLQWKWRKVSYGLMTMMSTKPYTFLQPPWTIPLSTLNTKYGLLYSIDKYVKIGISESEIWSLYDYLPHGSVLGKSTLCWTWILKPWNRFSCKLSSGIIFRFLVLIML